MKPVFAVVGRVNEGKSSIIATLTENDGIDIGPDPGTTRRSHRYYLELEGERLLEVVDTPGFQEPEAALDWMQRCDQRSAVDRPDIVRRFVDTFTGTEEFLDECELLKPIVEGAYVLYVADSGHPFRPSFETELEILRWTGAPRMALINRIGSGDYSEDWNRALSQYFNIIRPFNAHRAHLPQRLELLESLQVLDRNLRPSLQRSIEVLRDMDASRRRNAASTMATLIADTASFTMSLPYEGDELSQHRKEQLAADFSKELAKREQWARREVEKLYNYRSLSRREPSLKKPLFDEDLFGRVTWEFLGLSRTQLIAAGTLAGMAAGGALDVMVGGHSFLMGAVLGSVAGLGSTAYLSVLSPNQKMIGVTVWGHHTVVGPVRSPNFPWIVLDRALLHYQALMSRTHAMRTPMDVSESREKVGIVSRFYARRRSTLAVYLGRLRKGKDMERSRMRLADELETILREISAED